MIPLDLFGKHSKPRIERGGRYDREENSISDFVLGGATFKMKLVEKLRKTSSKHVEKPNIIKCEAKIKYLLAKACVNAIRGKDYINFNEFWRDLDNDYIKRRLENMGFRVEIIKDFRIYSGIFW